MGIVAAEEGEGLGRGRGSSIAVCDHGFQYVTTGSGGVRRCYLESSREHGETGRSECVVLVK